MQVASGVGAEELEGRRYDRAGSLPDLAIRTGQAQVVTSGHQRAVHRAVEPTIAVGPLLAIPLKGCGEARGTSSRPARSGTGSPTACRTR